MGEIPDAAAAEVASAKRDLPRKREEGRKERSRTQMGKWRKRRNLVEGSPSRPSPTLDKNLSERDLPPVPTEFPKALSRVPRLKGRNGHKLDISTAKTFFRITLYRWSDTDPKCRHQGSNSTKQNSKHNLGEGNILHPPLAASLHRADAACSAFREILFTGK